jgi:hypothetical protein
MIRSFPVSRPGVLGVVILCIAVLAGWPITKVQAQDVNDVMQAFVQAMETKNANGILAAFSRNAPWMYQPYEIGSGRRLQSTDVTPATMAHDWQQKSGWYNFFMEDPDGYTFRVNFIHRKPWKKRGADTFVAPDSSSGNTYIRWRPEGGRWVIGEIGETTP